ncbi:inositol monophosphatase 1-like [Cylas formicarius]|uniref:inositol monophosphatase 1-like n=1 Tax=Cylas formicarius TaxID=197179 RepID=UPI002958BFF1|nr:inositol monophosphatase 1-like [Cylas formicarius]
MTQHEAQIYYEFILPLVIDAGKILKDAQHIEVEIKNEVVWDWVTIYDRKIEEVLIKRIKERYPNHRYIGEEESFGETRELTDHPTWIIDPIDGTVNFVRNFPMSGISVALAIQKEIVVGVVYNPHMGELYTAVKGKGAYLNGNRIRTSCCKEMRKSVLNYELSLARRNEHFFKMYMYRTKHLIKAITGIRALGCAVLGLCYVANGRTDAYQADGLYPWDVAAGILIVREAGGYVIDTSGKEFDVMEPNFLATATRELSDQLMVVEKRADEELLNDTKLSESLRT